MKVCELIVMLSDLGHDQQDKEVFAFDIDEGEELPVTGVSVNSDSVTICTDD